jgi:hypothetical protein
VAVVKSSKKVHFHYYSFQVDHYFAVAADLFQGADYDGVSLGQTAWKVMMTAKVMFVVDSHQA